MTLCIPWATAADLPETCDTSAVKPVTLTDAMLYASQIMYDLTRHRYNGGGCEDEYRPLGCPGCWAALYCSTWCTDKRHFGIEIPNQPVTAITHVTLDGVVLVAGTDYELLEGRFLRRMGGESWPCGCDLDDPDYFIIDYVWGRAPHASLKRAAAILGWEFALLWTPECTNLCRLPSRVTSVTRQGISFAVADPLTLFKDGMTGVPEVDAMIQAELWGSAHRQPVIGVPGRGVRAIR